MLYLSEVGEAEQNIIKQAKRFNRPLPDRIANAPQLKVELQLYFQAFIELESERPEGFSGLRPIPGGAVRQYARDYEFSGDQTEKLIYFVRKMDKERLKK